MQDGHTVRRRTRPGKAGLAAFLECYEPTLVVVRGRLAGTEHPLEREKLVIGRGPSVDIALDDSETSSQHAAIEFTGEHFRICDLGSTNGTFVNGKRVHAEDLASGDRIEIGRQLLQLRLEERVRTPRIHLVPDD